MKKYAQVVLKRHIFGKDTFTFDVPDNLKSAIKVGQIVEVPIKNNISKGLVLDISSNKPAFETRSILKPIAPQMLSENQIKLMIYISKNYSTNLSRIIPMFLPEKIWNSDGLPPVKSLLEINKIPEKTLGNKQKIVIEYLQKYGTSDIEEIKKDLNVSSSVLNNLLKKEILKKSFREIFPNKQELEINTEKLPLNNDQKEAFEKLQKSNRCLLFGPTGSGKSHLIKLLSQEIVNENKQVLILVPEIAITNQLYKNFAETFDKKNIATYHSKLTDTEKYHEWWKIKSKQAKVILGSRSALFLPFDDLGLIVLEEEHDSSYKNDQSPRYNSNTIAEYLSELFNAKLIYSSATPSLEIYHKAENKKIDLIKLKARYSQKELSEKKIEIVDMKCELEAKNFSSISKKLEKEIYLTLAENKKIIIFLNRRGYYSSVVCKECGLAQKCAYCNVSLTHHAKEDKNYLLCHHCSRIYYVPKNCQNCKSTHFVFFGFGTQRVENELIKKFPNAKIKRADRDAIKSKKDTDEMFDDFFHGNSQILIGTQIITKGFDSDKVGLVGIILADTSLQIPDFRSAESTFQNLTQVIGRTGRKGTFGKVVIQTFLPDNFVIQTSAKEDYLEFYKKELANRKQFFLPPFSRIIKLTFKHTKKEIAFAKARNTYETIKKKLNKNESLFLAPALIPKKYGKYFVNILIQTNNPEKIIYENLLIDCIVDIDPTSSV